MQTSPPNPKLQKHLAEIGLGSRREIERWIEAGRVMVDDHIAQQGERVAATSTIYVDKKQVWPVTASASVLPSTVWVYHKPVGEITTRHDPEGRPTVFDHLPPLTYQRWISIGRLDVNTSGLLLFTTDGELAQCLTHPSHEIPRVYQMRLYGKMDDTQRANLLNGVMLEDGKAQFKSLEHVRGEGANHWYEASLAEGRNRVVRRLCESQGIRVNRLVRISFGPVILPEDLMPGKGRFLSKDLTRELYKNV